MTEIGCETGSVPPALVTIRNFPSGLLERSIPKFVEVGMGLVPAARLGGEVVRSITYTWGLMFVTKPRFRSGVIRTSPMKKLRGIGTVPRMTWVSASNTVTELVALSATMPRVRAESSKGATVIIITATNNIEQSVFAFMSYFLNEILLNRFCLYGNF